MTKKETPDFMDSLIPAPALNQEITKLVSWLLEQKSQALRDVPVSALELLGEYVQSRVREDRCERFVQDRHDEQAKMDKSCQDLAKYFMLRLERKDKPGSLVQEVLSIQTVLSYGPLDDEKPLSIRQEEALEKLFKETNPPVLRTPIEGLSELWQKAPEVLPVQDLNIPRPV